MDQTLPLGYKFASDARFVNRENCMGQSETFWEQDITSPEGKCIIACAGSAESARQLAIRRAIDDLERRLKDPLVRLGEIVNQDFPCHGEVTEALRCIYRILKNNP